MIRDQLTRASVKKLLLVIGLSIMVIFLATHSVVIVKTPENSGVSMSKTANDMEYHGNGTRHVKVVRTGKWYVSIQNGIKVSGKVIKTNPFMIPSTLDIAFGEQYTSSKITSFGDFCVLFDDPTKDLTLTSSCLGPNQDIHIAHGDKNLEFITSPANISKTAPTQTGFLYILKPPESESTQYTIGLYDTTKQQSSTLLEKIDLPSEPIIVSDSGTGLVGGVILNGKYVSIENLYAKKMSGFKVENTEPSREKTILAKQYKGKLYVYTGSSVEVLADVSLKPFKNPTLSTYTIKNGVVAETSKISSRYVFTDFTVTSNEIVGFTGRVYKSNASTLCIYTTKLTCSDPWENNDNITTIQSSKDNNFIYVANGKLWSYDGDSKITKLLYEASGLAVLVVNRVGNLLYISTSTKSSSLEQIYNFALDENTKAPNKNRIESYLPDSLDNDEQITIDTHRGEFLVTDRNQTKSLSNSTIKGQLKNLGIDSLFTQNTPISFTKPEINPPANPRILLFSSTPSED